MCGIVCHLVYSSLHRDGTRLELIAEGILVTGRALNLSAEVLNIKAGRSLAIRSGERHCGSIGNGHRVSRYIRAAVSKMPGHRRTDSRIRNAVIQEFSHLGRIAVKNNFSDLIGRLSMTCALCGLSGIVLIIVTCKGQAGIHDHKILQRNILGVFAVIRLRHHRRRNNKFNVSRALQQRVNRFGYSRLRDLRHSVAIYVSQRDHTAYTIGSRLYRIQVLRQGIPYHTVIVLANSLVGMIALRGGAYLDHQIGLGRISLAIKVGCTIIGRVVRSLQFGIPVHRYGSGNSCQEGFNACRTVCEIGGYFVDIELCLGTHVLGISACVKLEHCKINIRHVVYIDVIPDKSGYIEEVGRLAVFQRNGAIGKSRQRCLICRSSAAGGVACAFNGVHTNILVVVEIRLDQSVAIARLAQITVARRGLGCLDNGLRAINLFPDTRFLVLLIQRKGGVAILSVTLAGGCLHVVELNHINRHTLVVLKGYLMVVCVVLLGQRALELSFRVHKVGTRHFRLADTVSSSSAGFLQLDLGFIPLSTAVVGNLIVCRSKLGVSITALLLDNEGGGIYLGRGIASLDLLPGDKSAQPFVGYGHHHLVVFRDIDCDRVNLVGIRSGALIGHIDLSS